MDICFWNKCNNHCLICSNPEDFRKAKDYSFDLLTERIKSEKEKIENITITGGEPTIHPDFDKILDFLKKEFSNSEINLLTNGRRFSYPAFTRRCLGIRNLNIAVSLHGHNAKVHDKITRVKGSFAQAVAGLFNILKYRGKRQKVYVRVVINRLNGEHIYRILDLITKNFPFIDRVELIFMEIEGLAEENFHQVGLTYNQWHKQLDKIKPKIKKFKSLLFFHFPLCVIDVDLWKYVHRTLPEHEVAFAKQCNFCWCKKYCLGIHKGYLKIVGSGEFNPPKKVEVEEDDFNPKFHPIADVNY